MVYLKKNNYNIYLEYEEKSCLRVFFGRVIVYFLLLVYRYNCFCIVLCMFK